jgi:hypothetical protein
MNTRRDCWPYASDWDRLSPLRQWLIEELGRDFPRRGIYYDNERAFYKWTCMTHADCVKLFNRNPPGTTCTSFLQIVHNRIMLAGRVKSPRSFNAFALNRCGANNKGWHTLGGRQRPSPGDFYQQSNPTKGFRTQHVGVLYGAWGAYCTVIGGGADQPPNGAIKRDTIPFPPQDRTHHFEGWLNIDEFYAGWIRH